MTTITTRLIISLEGAISLADPIPPGEHIAQVTVLETAKPRQSLDYASFPKADVGAWPEGLSLRREDMYGDDGR